MGWAQAFSDFSVLQLQRRALLKWQEGRPRSVFLVKKPNSAQASVKLGEIAAWCALDLIPDCATGLPCYRFGGMGEFKDRQECNVEDPLPQLH